MKNSRYKLLLRYKVPIILFAFIVTFNIILFAIYDSIEPRSRLQDISIVIPFIGNIEILFIFIVMFPIMALIGGLMGFIFAPAFLWLHKTVFGRNVTYGIEDVHKSKKYKRIFQGFFPGLMAINFSLLISDNEMIQQLSIPSIWFDQPAPMPQLITFIVGIMFTLIIAFALFSGLWAITDSGIVFSNKKGIEKKGKEKPIIAQSIGGSYNYILKGYAGIGVLILYYELVFLFYGGIGLSHPHPYVNFLNIYLFMSYFIIVPLLTIPATIVIDILRDRRVKFTRKIAAKLGIVDEVVIEFNKVSK